MSSRQLKAIFGALVVLVLAYAAVQFLSGNGHRSGGNDIVAAVRDGISLVRILGPGAEDSVRLEEADGSWTVNGYPADSALVRQLSEGLDTAQIGRLVARSVTNHARLGVAEDSARRIKIGPAGAPYVEFLLGRGGPDGRYVRFPSSDEVFSIPAASMRLLAHSAEEWRNRIVAAVDTSLVSRIEVRRNDEPAPLELSRAIGDSAVSWSLGGAAADSATVDALLGESANLTATGFPSDFSAALSPCWKCSTPTNWERHLHCRCSSSPPRTRAVSWYAAQQTRWPIGFRLSRRGGCCRRGRGCFQKRLNRERRSLPPAH